MNVSSHMSEDAEVVLIKDFNYNKFRSTGNQSKQYKENIKVEHKQKQNC